MTPIEVKGKFCALFDDNQDKWIEEKTCQIVSENLNYFTVKFQKSGDYAILTLKSEEKRFYDIY